MFLYKTVYREAKAEQVINKSRFIAYVSPVDSYEEAQAFVSRIKEQHKDATHNVPAVICGQKQEIKWMSDDGEPQGTSGPPILKMLADEGLTNIAVVVTRYFGGIKLGTGGLVRAYSSSAKLGIEAAGICDVCDSVSMRYRIDYTYLAKLQNLAKNGNFVIKDIEYSDAITLTLVCETEYRESVLSVINDITAGSCEMLSESEGRIKLIK